jgi:hypothetical protein
MKRESTASVAPRLAGGVAGSVPCRSGRAEIEFTLQTRDPATGRIVLTKEKVDPKRTERSRWMSEFPLVQDGDNAVDASFHG